MKKVLFLLSVFIAVTLMILAGCSNPLSNVLGSEGNDTNTEKTTGTLYIEIPELAPWVTREEDPDLAGTGSGEVGTQAYLVASTVEFYLYDSAGNPVSGWNPKTITGGTSASGSVPAASGYTLEAYIYNLVIRKEVAL